MLACICAPSSLHGSPLPLTWCTMAAQAAATSGKSPAATAARMAQPRAGASATCREALRSTGLATSLGISKGHDRQRLRGGRAPPWPALVSQPPPGCSTPPHFTPAPCLCEDERHVGDIGVDLQPQLGASGTPCNGDRVGGEARGPHRLKDLLRTARCCREGWPGSPHMVGGESRSTVCWA